MKQGFKTEWVTEDLCGCARGSSPETQAADCARSLNGGSHHPLTPLLIIQAPRLHARTERTALKDLTRMRKHATDFMRGHPSLKKKKERKAERKHKVGKYSQLPAVSESDRSRN